MAVMTESNVSSSKPSPHCPSALRKELDIIIEAQMCLEIIFTQQLEPAEIGQYWILLELDSHFEDELQAKQVTEANIK